MAATLQSSKSGVGNNSVRKIIYSNFEYLNIPGKELNVNKFSEQIMLFQEKNNIRSHKDYKFISILLRALI